MCQNCQALILENVDPGDELLTASGEPFVIEDIQGDIISHRGGKKWFHLSHATMCYHWMLDGNVIEGVGSGARSVRGLVGRNGQLVRCNKCEWNPAYIWALLNSLPNVQRQDNNLSIPPEEE